MGLSLEEQYNTALAIAESFHRGQTDKAGKPYIEHVTRVSSKCDTLEERIAGLLHDIVEDTECTLEHLQKVGFNSNIIEAISLLTRVKGQRYTKYIANISRNSIAREVKLRDLEDNMDTTRLKSIIKKDEERQIKYRKAYKTLQNTYRTE